MLVRISCSSQTRQTTEIESEITLQLRIPIQNVKNGQLKQKCAINFGIQQNGSNKTPIKCKNLFAVKSILKSIQRFARYKILALISIGRLCICLKHWLNSCHIGEGRRKSTSDFETGVVFPLMPRIYLHLNVWFQSVSAEVCMNDVRAHSTASSANLNLHIRVYHPECEGRP